VGASCASDIAGANMPSMSATRLVALRCQPLIDVIKSFVIFMSLSLLAV
jgi:hypothetical protein